MIKNGKFLVDPPQKTLGINELLLQTFAQGAGRNVSESGDAVGPWSPKLLTEEISRVDPMGQGVDPRTVRRWFSENDRKVKTENVTLLAQIFGCGDPKATTAWRVKLLDANRRQGDKKQANEKVKSRRQQIVVEEDQKNDPVLDQSATTTGPAETTKDPIATRQRRRFNLATASESLFSESPLNLPSLVFAGAAALGFMSYILGIHEATFDAAGGNLKQVGFLWAPNWTLLFMAFMPLYFAFASELLVFWKSEGRPRLAAYGDRNDCSRAWARNIEASSYTFWAVLLVCVLFAGVFQWVGVRLLPLLHGGGDHATDWASLAIIRPEVISVPEAIAFTGLAYLYMSICFYLFFSAMILLYSVAQDFGKIQAAQKRVKDTDYRQEASLIGARMIRKIFRCTVLAVLVAVCMKLQSTYLASNGTNIVQWLIGDMASILNASDKPGSLGDYSAPNHFSSFLIVLSAVFVFTYCASRLDVGFRFPNRLRMMAATIGLLVVGYLLIGAFAGFSILLGFTVLLAIFALYEPGF